MTFTVDSDLNGAGPQFTLTCISTGGPATTVTWTRDSNTITEGTDTTLDDQMTAQYIHTLTVTGRLGGLYTCTVANDKPSEDSANFTVEGKDIYKCQWCRNWSTCMHYDCKIHLLCQLEYIWCTIMVTNECYQLLQLLLT